MKRSRWAQVALGVLLGLATVVGFAALVTYLREWVRELFAGPLGYAIYLTGLLLRSVPQAVFLGVLIVLGIVMAFKSLGAQTDFSGLPTRRRSEDTRYSRMQRWISYLSEVDRSEYAREKMMFEMRSLVLAALATLERTSPLEIELRIANGTLPAPPEVVEVVLVGRRRANNALRRWPTRVVHTLRERLFGHRHSAHATQSPAWTTLHAALSWIEAQQFTDEDKKDTRS
ncbi:MAG: hypothetical protein RMN25_09235 [Anaerolineae bacterium]|nr:hypothetical protein [Thermoflexales bacterium]MDW8407952.1 hypothetical protein [Anaerolineae bacterium]